MKKLSSFLAVLLISTSILPTVSLATENSGILDNEEKTSQTAQEPITSSEETAEIEEEESTPTTEASDSETISTEETIEETTEQTESSTTPLPEEITSEETGETKETTKPTKKPIAQQKEQTKPSDNLVDETDSNEAESENVESGNFTFTPTTTEKQFIQKIGNIARKVAYENDLYASVMIAQASLESGFGNSGLANEPHYNLFGIKGSNGEKSVSMRTQEEIDKKMVTINSQFRSYDSYEESIEDYAELIKKGIDSNASIYSGVTKENAATYQDATSQLVGVYATDSQYDKKLNAIIKAYDLTRFDTMPMQFVEHTVKNGETFMEIAKHYDVLLSAISYEDKKVTETTPVPIGEVILIEQPVKFELPLTKTFQITSGFGTRGAEHHDGIDLAVATNTPVYAAQAGEVVATGYDKSAGNYVIIKHIFGLYTNYFHLSEVNVAKGDEVGASEQIGLVGSTGNSTGPHLHFGVSDAPWESYYDPADFLEFESNS